MLTVILMIIGLIMLVAIGVILENELAAMRKQTETGLNEIRDELRKIAGLLEARNP
jgi:hypothetical protein